MRQSVRTILTIAALGVAAIASAQDYPTKVVRILVPYSAGGPVDIVARGMAQKLSENWSHP
jgi:tripartite-type tricarboxylate transporter receptor subunit TctC